MKKIAVHLAEGFEEIEAVSIIDVLRRADLEVIVVSVGKTTEVKGSHGITIIADEIFTTLDYEFIDMIILPGGMPGSKNLNEHAGLREQILNFNESGKQLAAICAAPMVLGNLGVLKSKKATCYPGFENELHGAVVTADDVVIEENLITGKGAGVAIKFALAIVERFKGKEFADELKKKMIAN
jgi:4-methyl-5(b-hydroxyethyl)-thiazole monophosphate biosynthesis